MGLGGHIEGLRANLGGSWRQLGRFWSQLGGLRGNLSGFFAMVIKNFEFSKKSADLEGPTRSNGRLLEASLAVLEAIQQTCCHVHNKTSNS